MAINLHRELWCVLGRGILESNEPFHFIFFYFLVMDW